MEHQEQKILIHRINTAARVIKHFQLGSVNLMLGRKGVLESIEIVKGCHTVASFSSIGEFEAYTDDLMLREENMRIKDPVLRSRKAGMLMRQVAEIFNSEYYDVPSKMNKKCKDVTTQVPSQGYRQSSQRKISAKQIAV